MNVMFSFDFIARAGNVVFEPDVGCVVFALVLHLFLKYSCVVVVFVVEGAFVVCLFFIRFCRSRRWGPENMLYSVLKRISGYWLCIALHC